jgi:hypothetical protein
LESIMSLAVAKLVGFMGFYFCTNWLWLIYLHVFLRPLAFRLYLDVEIGAWNSELEICQVQFACLDGHKICIWKST